MFYPQLVVGPIERPQHLLHQFCEVHRVDVARIADGLALMLWGFSKRWSLPIVSLFLWIKSLSTSLIIRPRNCCCTLFFQIYCDFSGYSHIATGAARVMGFTLMKNFDAPYLATSISDFWRRYTFRFRHGFVIICISHRRQSRFIPGLMQIRSSHFCERFVARRNWTYVIWGFMVWHCVSTICAAMSISFGCSGVSRWLCSHLQIGLDVPVCFFRLIFFRHQMSLMRFGRTKYFSDGNIGLSALTLGQGEFSFVIAIIGIALLMFWNGQQFHDLHARFSRQPLFVWVWFICLACSLFLSWETWWPRVYLLQFNLFLHHVHSHSSHLPISSPLGSVLLGVVIRIVYYGDGARVTAYTAPDVGAGILNWTVIYPPNTSLLLQRSVSTIAVTNSLGFHSKEYALSPLPECIASLSLVILCWGFTSSCCRALLKSWTTIKCAWTRHYGHSFWARGNGPYLNLLYLRQCIAI